MLLHYCSDISLAVKEGKVSTLEWDVIEYIPLGSNLLENLENNFK